MAGGIALATGFVLASVPGEARAEPPAAAPRAASRGLAVVGLDGTTSAALALAKAVAESDGLRAVTADDPRAHVLAGESAAEGASKDLRDLADTRAAIHGDDAPSKALLAAIAQKLQVRGLLVVQAGPVARVFLAETGEIDAARYEPDMSPPGQPISWVSAARSLTRAYATTAAAAPTPPATTTPTRIPGPAAALREGPHIDNTPPSSRSRKFYESPWFWGAIGAAAFAGGAIYFATKDNTPQTIHLQLQVPH